MEASTPVFADGTIQVRIADDDESLRRAATSLLGKSESDIRTLVLGVVRGQMQESVGSGWRAGDSAGVEDVKRKCSEALQISGLSVDSFGLSLRT